MFTIAVDVMGGDLGPHVALKACKKFLRTHNEVSLTITILQPLVAQAQHYLAAFSSRVRVIGCEAQISMQDKPSRMLRSGTNTTMAAALLEVQTGRAQAVLSAGNTGALMILSKHLLQTFQGIERPALATLVPTRHKPLLMLDLGANVNVSASQLSQFAAMGWCWSWLQQTEHPQVALLNVGREAGKGSERLQEADKLCLQMLGKDYHGFCEGHDIFAGRLDVVVTDGFVGNVVLKASESMAHWLTDLLHQQFHQHWLRRYFVPVWYRALKRIEKLIAPARHGGALLLGIDGVVVKTHGSSDTRTFLHALNYVLELVKHYDAEVMQRRLSELLLKVQ